jgi:nicotinamide-nucleotide amidase
VEIALLLTGNELMTGDTVDSNSAMIASTLAERGFNVGYKSTVGDLLDTLVSEIDRLTRSYPVLIINGGLGPTTDDLTAEALAKSAGLNLVENIQAKSHLLEWCTKRRIELNAANLKQVFLPDGAEVVHNPVGSAVGICIKINDCVVISTPGVPSELRAMLNAIVPERLQAAFPGARSRLIRRIKIFGLGESQLQQLIHDNLKSWPSDVGLGFRAGLPLLELKLEIDEHLHLAKRDAMEKQLSDLIGDFIIGENDETLPQVLVDMLTNSGEKVALAESCTGGAIAAQITAIAGASNVFETGVVSYSNACKSKLLGVSEKLLETYGAVSVEVVRAMAEGVLNVSNAKYAIAVSGIAGPDGGSDDKPVGTVWIAWGSKNNIVTRRFFLPARRSTFQQLVSSIAIDSLRRYLQGIHAVPDYFGRK